MLIRLLACIAMGAARLGELALSRSNMSHGWSYREGRWSRRTYPGIVALHTGVIVVTALRGGRVHWPWFLLLGAMQPLRIWTLLTLRSRWNARGAVPSAMEVETGGPYAVVRHPNYLVVAIELLTLPLAFGLRRFALLMAVPHAVLLAIRIRDEERLLYRLPGYLKHFKDKARFIPFVF